MKARPSLLGIAVVFKILMLVYNQVYGTDINLYDLDLLNRNDPARRRRFWAIFISSTVVVGAAIHCFFQEYVEGSFVLIVAISAGVDVGLFDILGDLMTAIHETAEDQVDFMTGGPYYFGWPRSTGGVHDDALSYVNATGGLERWQVSLGSLAKRMGVEWQTAQAEHRIAEDSIPELDAILEMEDTADAPAALVCPLTKRLMAYAVVAADGHSYERRALQDWLHGDNPKSVSPTSGLPLAFLGMVPNHQLRNVAKVWAENSQRWWELIDEELVCAITMDRMEDPVLTSDGHSYSREAIVQWLRRHDVGPRTNINLESLALITNCNLAQLIEEKHREEDNVDAATDTKDSNAIADTKDANAAVDSSGDTPVDDC